MNAGKVFGILGDNLENVIGTACGQMTFKHIGDARHRLFKGFKHFIGLRVQGDFHENRRWHAHFAGIQKGDIPLDIPLRLKPLHPSVTGTGRKGYLVGKIGIGYAPALLQDPQQTTIVRIK